jgi:sulfate permease, SulP family
VSILLQLNRAQMDLRVVQLRLRPDGAIEECELPPATPSETVTVVDAYGSLLFAGARTLQARLPDPAGARRPVVVLRLRGRTSFGATFVVAVDEYATRLAAVGGRLVLSGVDPHAIAYLASVRRRELAELVDVVPATAVLGESTRRAVALGEAWLQTEGAEESEW